MIEIKLFFYGFIIYFNFTNINFLNVFYTENNCHKKNEKNMNEYGKLFVRIVKYLLK